VAEQATERPAEHAGQQQFPDILGADLVNGYGGATLVVDVPASSAG